jgi:hypothetical protein
MVWFDPLQAEAVAVVVVANLIQDNPIKAPPELLALPGAALDKVEVVVMELVAEVAEVVN